MDWKKLGKKLLFPPIWVIIIFVILSTVALVTVFVKGWQFLPVSSVVYVLAFYSLTIFCGLCLQYIPRYYITMKGLIYRNKYANQYYSCCHGSV